MRIPTLAAGVCAAAFIPTMALAQQTCEQRQTTRVVGTVAGAGVGALAGSAIAGHGDHTTGAVVGGLAGALLGNQLAKGAADCTHAYGYYDTNGAWHANAVARNSASGYFDRNGAWVQGAPRGHYDRDGRWVQAATDERAAGYYDSRGLWVPASASGYYTSDGRWVAAAVPGHYDRSGRWIAGASTGRYNADGQWLAGQVAGTRDSNGVWTADPQPGYYQNGRWIRGEAIGYYDARGRWISTDGREQRADYGDTSASPSIDQRQAQLARRIDRGMESGRLSPTEAHQAMRTLASIEREEQSFRNRRGQLSSRGIAMINRRLDQLSADIREDARSEREDADHRYSSR
jgi:hypothetical protein